MRTGNPSGAALERDPNAYDGIPNYEAVPPPEVRCFTEHLREAAAQRVPAHVRDAVRGALGRTGAVEAGAAGTFARDVVGALAAELLPGLKDL